MKMHRGWKLTPLQRDQIVAIASMYRGRYPLYPLEYIAALYGITDSSVSQLLRRRLGPRRRHRTSRDVAKMGMMHAP